MVSLRDSLVARIVESGHSVPSDLDHWMIKRVLTGIETALAPHKQRMRRDVVEAFEVHWPSLAKQIRTIRNDAGHPSSANPVREESVHAELITFPVVLHLALRLQSWINSDYNQ